MKFRNPMQLIDKKIVKLIIRITCIVTIVSVLIIVLTISLRNRNLAAREREQIEKIQKILNPDMEQPEIEDFYRNTGDSKMGITYPVHQRKSKWSKDDVQFYWINSRDAGLNTLSKRNNQKIYDSLEISTP